MVQLGEQKLRHQALYCLKKVTLLWVWSGAASAQEVISCIGCDY